MGIQDRPYIQRDEFGSPFGAPTTIITRIIIINVVVWFIDMFGQQPMTRLFCLDTDLFRTHFKIFGLLTSGFVHAGINSPGTIFLTHILFNMLTLYMIGRMVETALGWKEFLRFYLIAIVFSGLAWLLTTWLTSPAEPVQRVVGASGGVAAVVVLFALRFPNQSVRLWGVFEMPAWVLGVLFVGMDVIRAIGMPDSGIAATAHLGGAGFAALYQQFRWNFGDMSGRLFPNGANIFRRGPKLRVHRPERDQDVKLAEQADRVLDKLHRDGEESLTKAERKTLEKYSRRVRQKKTNT